MRYPRHPVVLDVITDGRALGRDGDLLRELPGVKRLLVHDALGRAIPPGTTIDAEPGIAEDVLPADAAVARKLTYTRLADLARQANVKLEHGSNATKHEKGSELSKLTTNYTLTGDYRDVRKFIYSLETAPEFIVLENIGLLALTQDLTRGNLASAPIASSRAWRRPSTWSGANAAGCHAR